MNRLLAGRLTIVFILLFSAFVYFYKIETIPSGFYVDEATVSYNAYSITQTGRDEYGFFMPLYFRLMGSYTPSLFIYIAAFLIKIFGMSVFLVRSVSTVCALASVYIFYLLLRKMKLFKLEITYFFIAFIYAISPWVVFNARLGYETTLGFLLFNIGTYFLYLAVFKSKNLIWGTFFLSLSTYASHNQRFLAPLFLIVYLVVFRKKLLRKNNREILIKSALVGLIVNIPNLSLIGTRAFWIKGGQLHITFIWNFLLYLSPKTLFFKSPDIDMQHSIPKLSMMYDWMVIPYFIGLYMLLRRIKEDGYKYILLYIVVSLFPAVFTGYFHSSQRSLAFAIPLLIVIGVGCDEIFKRLKKYVVYVLVTFLLVYSSLMLYEGYFVLFPKERASAWNYGYDKVAEYIINHPERQFLFDDTRNPRAYSILLYYTKAHPKTYQAELGTYYSDNYYRAFPPATNYHFKNVEVRPINWEVDTKRDIVIIGDNLSISETQMEEHGITKINEILDDLNNVIFVFYETNLQTVENERR